MPKHDFFSPKAIANRIKAKGLQKLKWYCQMCNKQCRDENGFKCHKMSESHQRQMKLFSSNPGKFMNQFSREFERGFMQIFRLKGGRRVKANEVYQDYIKDRHHFHMNATVWSTLTGFVMYLGRTGKAKVEEGQNHGSPYPVWWITYIDTDPDTLTLKKKKKEIIKAENKMLRYEEDQLNNYYDSIDIKNIKTFNEIKCDNVDVNQFKNVKFSLKKSNKSNDDTPTSNNNSNESNEDNKTNNSHKEINKSSNNSAMNNSNNKINDNPNKIHKIHANSAKNKDIKDKNVSKKRKRSEMDNIITELEHKKKRIKLDETRNAKREPINTWLSKGIIVKINNTKSEYNGKKCEIIGIHTKNNHTFGDCHILKLNKQVSIKEKYLETVIPKFGRKVMILNGKYKHKIGTLKDINKKKFIVKIYVNRKIIDIPYDFFSKIP